MNQVKMVFDLCQKYNIPQNGFNDIHAYMRELYRPESEIISIYKQILKIEEGGPLELQNVRWRSFYK